VNSTRRAPVLLLWVAGVLLAARIGLGVYQGRHQPTSRDLVNWRPVVAAEAEARKARRPILYDFTAEWCPPCRAMQREVFGDRSEADFIDKTFVPVRVLDRKRESGRNPPEVEALQKRFKIDSFPTLVVVSPRGGEPVVLSGYVGKVRTLSALNEAARKLVAVTPKR